MKIAKSLLMGFGSVVLAGLILTLLAPNAARGIAATAVQVVNTAGAPLPIYDVDAPGRHVFQQECSSTSVTGCTLSPAVPSGMVFVVQSFHNFWDPGTTYNPNIQLLNTVATFPTHLTLTTNGILSVYAIPNTVIASSAGAGTISWVAWMNVTLYEDASTAPTCAFNGNLGPLSLNPSTFSCIVTGHLTPINP
jgi:hypothetical protein